MHAPAWSMKSYSGTATTAELSEEKGASKKKNTITGQWVYVSHGVGAQVTNNKKKLLGMLEKVTAATEATLKLQQITLQESVSAVMSVEAERSESINYRLRV